MTIPASFARQAARYASNAALKTASWQLSYRELDALTDSLAARLIHVSGRDREPVGLLTDQANIAIAMLGATKAGKIYVPLEPSDPPDAISSVLYNAQAATLITDASYRELASQVAGTNMSVLELEHDATLSTEELRTGSQAESDIACVLYTSGTTDLPKGVMFDHRGLLHMIEGNTRSLQITADDRIALVSSSAFIGTTATVFRALLNGATLMPFELRIASITDFVDWLEEQKITLLQLVPTLFRHLAHELNKDPRKLSLRLIHLAGEVMDRHDLALFEACFPHCKQLVNEAGATETGAFSRLHLRHGERPKARTVPVGQATEDKEILLLGPDGKPQPHGKIGKIAIRSQFLARGYWQHEADTASQFQRVPGKAGHRQFLTGDLGVMDDQGCLTIAGRADSQIKLRGRRLDLTGLESRLRSETKSQGAAVTVVEEAGKDPKLVAYLETHDSELSVPDLQSKLRHSLASYMVPEAFVLLKRFPLTASGKIDRRNLPLPECEAPTNSHVAPSSDIERLLAKFWARELKLPQVSVQDDFLQLGGESLFAGKTISYVRQQWSVTLTFGEFFDLRTIAELASVIEERMGS